MRIRAKHWVKYNGEWHRAGEEFDVEAGDAEAMKEHGEPVPDAGPETEETKEEEPKETARKGRRKTAN